MEMITVCVCRFLACYLLVIAILGSLGHVCMLLSSVTTTATSSANDPGISNKGDHNNISHSDVLVSSSGSSSSVNTTQAEGEREAITPAANVTASSNKFSFTWFLNESVLVYEISFPATNFRRVQISSGEYSNDQQSNEFPVPEILVTLLSSIFLVRGTWKMEYTSCQFWYNLQVGSLLLSCLKIALFTMVGLWHQVSYVSLLAVVFALAQLWLVQNFMEDLSRLVEHRRHRKWLTQKRQIFAMHNDLDVETCRFVLAKAESI